MMSANTDTVAALESALEQLRRQSEAIAVANDATAEAAGKIAESLAELSGVDSAVVKAIDALESTPSTRLSLSPSPSLLDALVAEAEARQAALADVCLDALTAGIEVVKRRRETETESE